MAPEQHNKFVEFIKKELGIDTNPLKDAEIEKLTKYILSVIALETPMIAKNYRNELGLK